MGGGVLGGEEGWIYFVKPRPSMRTTMKVLGKRPSGCSKERTYPYLAAGQSVLLSWGSVGVAVTSDHEHEALALNLTHFEFAMVQACKRHLSASRSHSIADRNYNPESRHDGHGG